MQQRAKLAIKAALCAVVVSDSAVVTLGQGDNDALAKSPPMGWNSYNAFLRNYDEDVLYPNVELMDTLGLVDLGYNYFNVDGVWWDGDYKNGKVYRNESGHWVEPLTKFPSGVAAFSDFVHDHGMKLGWYTSGRDTACCCAPSPMKPMSMGYEAQDTERLKEWRVDYFKIDNCASSGSGLEKSEEVLKRWTSLLKGSKIVVENCRMGCMAKVVGKKKKLAPANKQKLPNWCRKTAHLTRVSKDIGKYIKGDHLNGKRIASWESIMYNAMASRGLEDTAGPGFWLHLDTLDIGNGELSLDENQSHFALWSIVSSALIFGTDLRKINIDHLSILRNERAIRVNQLYGGDNGRFIEENKNIQLWAKRLPNKELAVLVLNVHKKKTLNVELEFGSAKWHKTLRNHIAPSKYKPDQDTLECIMENIWSRTFAAAYDSQRLRLRSHQGAFLVLSKCKISKNIAVTPPPEPTEPPRAPTPYTGVSSSCLLYNPSCRTATKKRSCNKLNGCQWCPRQASVENKELCRTKLSNVCFDADKFDHCVGERA